MAKRRIIIPAVCCLIWAIWPVISCAEMIVDTAWVRTYDLEGWPDYATAIAVDNSGNVYATGSSWNGENYDYATIKYYSDGNTAWVRTYNGPGDGWDVVSGMVVDSHSIVYVTGLSWDSTTWDDWVTVKYSPNGDTHWMRRYDGPASLGDYAHAITVDDSGYVYVTGSSYDTATYSGSNSNYLTIKYDPGGDTVWVRIYDGPASSNDVAEALAVDGLGNVYVTGASHSREAFEDYATIKYLANGDAAWVRRYDGPAYLRDEAFSIDVDGSGNVCVTGWSWNGTEYDYATVKYCPDGDTAWVRRHDGPGGHEHLLDSEPSVATDELGNVYVAGSSCTNRSDCDYLTVKYSPNGDIAWTRRYDGPANGADHVSDLVIDHLGDIYVTGASAGVGTNLDYASVKYDSSGQELWVRRYNGPEGNFDRAEAIVVDVYGNVYVTGTSRNSGSQEDFVTVKYVQTGLWRGDTNSDGIVDIGDVVHLINHLYRNGAAPDPLTVGDCNCDGAIELGDLVFLINYLFKAGPPPDCW